jgi:hypothetical protein
MAGVLLLAACGGEDGHRLFVDVQTDLVPGVELDLLAVSLERGGSVLHGLDAAVSPSQSFVEGRRVAELGGLSPGAYDVRVSAVLRGSDVVSRVVEVDLRGDVGVLVILTRDCTGVTCPGPDDPARASTCIGGACEDPGCVRGNEEVCGGAECRRHSDCVPDSECIEARCEGAWCLQIPRDDRCIGGVCDRARGCVASSPDGGVDDGGGADGGVVPCAMGTANCNGDDVDGCEADLGSAATCGACDVACTDELPLCSGGECVSGCAAGETLCSGSCVDTGTSLSHCGACGNVCSLANAAESCATGSCAISTCDPGWADCDGVASSGCEQSLSSVAHCGGCDNVCSLANAAESCAGGSCAILTCDAGWANCDGSDSNGCEQQLNTLTNCGSCGTFCGRANASETCSTGTCRISTCNPGWGNCNGVDADGCEISLTTNESHCGMCGNACGGMRTCIGGTCGAT